jgi:23S rRNA (cytosine1962-C5)-methyltransferase
MDSNEKYTIIRLKPKVSSAKILAGFPWVYDNELVLDRRTKKLTSGKVVELQDSERNFLATAVVNPNSKIFARVLTNTPKRVEESELVLKRINKAKSLRDSIFKEPYYRLVNSEADQMPGTIIDRFGSFFVIQLNSVWSENNLENITKVLVQIFNPDGIFKNSNSRARALEGLDDRSLIVHGSLPSAPLKVPMNGAIYMADLNQGQKTGLFYDQRQNHAFLASISKNKTVLDVFSHVGGFALAALAGGAAEATAIDSSQAALDLAEQGAIVNGFDSVFSVIKDDAFNALKCLRSEEKKFDIVVCDPPAFAPSKQALSSGLRAYERLARISADLVEEGGILVLCSCSHAASLLKFRESCIRGINLAGRNSSIIFTGFAGPDHPVHPMLSENGYLKSLFLSL